MKNITLQYSIAVNDKFSKSMIFANDAIEELIFILNVIKVRLLRQNTRFE